MFTHTTWWDHIHPNSQVREKFFFFFFKVLCSVIHGVCEGTLKFLKERLPSSAYWACIEVCEVNVNIQWREWVCSVYLIGKFTCVKCMRSSSDVCVMSEWSGCEAHVNLQCAKMHSVWSLEFFCNVPTTSVPLQFSVSKAYVHLQLKFNQSSSIDV